MKSTLEKVSSLERKLSVQVAAAEVESALEQAYSDIQKRAEIKGFRKGKAPLATIRSIYADRVKQDLIQDLIQTHYQKALQEHQLSPISYPEIDFEPLADGIDFKFSAQFEIRPQVQVKNFENLNVKKEKMPDMNAKVNESLDNIRRNRAEHVPVLEDRGAQSGDVVDISFHGTQAGIPVEGGSADHFTLELGSKQMIEGFESGIEGMRAGESRTLHLQFPEGYHATHLAGKPVTFDIKVKALKKKSLPELNDEFAKSLGQFESLDALKKTLLENTEEEEKRRIDSDVRTRIVEALVEKNPVELPKSLVVEQMKMLSDDVRNRLQGQGYSEEQIAEYVQKWESDIENSAKFMVHSSFLIDQLAEDHGLHWTEADFDERLNKMAAQSGLEMAKIEEFYKQPNTKSRLCFRITEEKVVDFLLSKAKITEIEASELTSNG